MRALLIWLEGKRVLNAGLLVVYFLLVVLPHKLFGTFLNKVVFKGITRDEYNLIVALTVAILGIAFLGYIWNKAAKRNDKNRILIYLLLTTVFAIVIIKFLFVINIEVVHFPQYALFAILLFPILKNYNHTLAWTTVAGSWDEAYQYFVLSPIDTGYYDFNDVITNLVGGAFGLIVLRSLGFVNRRNFSIYKSPFTFYLILLLAALIGLDLTNVLSVGPSDAHSFQLVQEWPAKFWSNVYPNVTYHVVRPLEGCLIVIFLMFFYSKIGADPKSVNEI